MSSYLNKNGLIEGKIPAGQPCPFYDKCTHKTDNCPSENNLKAEPFSCGLARLFSMYYS